MRLMLLTPFFLSTSTEADSASLNAALVKAWRQIFDDLADALDRPPPI